MANRVTRLQMEKALDSYLAERELLLQKKVDAIALKLFDKVFEKYYKGILELNDEGKLIYNTKNINAVNGLDKIFKNWRDNDNIPVIKTFVNDALQLSELNEKYFETITPQPTTLSRYKAEKVTKDALGLDKNNKPIKGGFTDKVIRDEDILKTIKKESLKAITKGQGFQQFRDNLKETLVGQDGQPLGGKVQQYYRNHAYDTLHKVDRLNADTFAKELKIKYFRWSGGIIKTTRELCRRCNGKIVNSQKFSELKYFNLKDSCKPGVPNPWRPLLDLGGYGCRHRKNYLPDSIAQKYKKDWLNMNTIVR